MTLAVDTSAPTTIYAGDAYSWTVPAPTGFAPADGYTASLRYVGATTSIVGTAAASLQDWLVTLTAAQSATLPAGSVQWRLSAVATVGTDVRTIAIGSFRVIAAPKLGTGTASSSQAERTLQLWLDRAEQQAGDLLQEYTVGGTRSAKRYTPQEITKQIAYWSAKVFAERNGSGCRVHAVRF